MPHQWLNPKDVVPGRLLGKALERRVSYSHFPQHYYRLCIVITCVADPVNKRRHNQKVKSRWGVKVMWLDDGSLENTVIFTGSGSGFSWHRFA